MTASNKIEKIRWPVRTRCAFCYGVHVTVVSTPEKGWNSYHCEDCDKDFTVISNNVFQKTHLSSSQVLAIIRIFERRQLKKKPSVLCKIVNVHHWTMTKIIDRIKGYETVGNLLHTPIVSLIEESLQDPEVGFDSESIDVAILLVTYKFLTKDPKWLKAISGCSEEVVSKALDRIRASWPEGKEFEEEDKEHNWYDSEGWESPKAVVTLTLHVLCVCGEINRDPQTGIYSISEERRSKIDGVIESACVC